MKTFILSLLSCLAVLLVKSQPAAIDSLNNILRKTNNDTLRLVVFNRLGDAYLEVNIDSALFSARQYLQLSQKLHYRLNEADALQQMGEYLPELGNSGDALEVLFRALQLLEENSDEKNILPPQYLAILGVPKDLYPYSRYQLYMLGKVNAVLGFNYAVNSKRKAFTYIEKATTIAESLHADDILLLTNEVLAFFAKPDSALIYLKKSYQLAIKTGQKKRIPEIVGGMINAYHRLGDHVSELDSLRAILKFSLGEERLLRVGYSYLILASYFFTETKALDSAIFFAMKALQMSQHVHSPYLEFYANELLVDVYKNENIKDSAFKYLEMKVAAREKTTSEDKVRQFQNADFNRQQQQSAVEAGRKQFRNNIRIYGLLAGLSAFLLLTIILWRNSKQRQKAFGLLQTQKAKTEEAMQELRSTQSQLIQSEKMASLGELTAGIAHEMQNPLNFVNNFSEVNSELIAEMKQEIDRGNIAEVKLIASDIEENEQKILYHGKRADAIVKGMLQHSRTSTGQKEPTDINALTDEYLRLSYHGLRAKDKSFNVTTKTDFDESIDRISIIPQDIGRVLLNLFNNAFYAVGEKKKQLGDAYEPVVSVTTRIIIPPPGGQRVAEIIVSDNGNGIPEKVRDKIFQPFFTTKPAGHGTGLGLSLSYDIVKAHGGELKVETKEGEGAMFIILLSL